MNRWLRCAAAVLAVSILTGPAAAGDGDRPVRGGHERHRPVKTPKAVQPQRQDTGVPCQRYGICSSNGCFPWPPGCRPSR